MSTENLLLSSTVSRRPFEIQFSLLADVPSRRTTRAVPQPKDKPSLPKGNDGDLPWVKHALREVDVPAPQARPAVRWGDKWRGLLRAEGWLDAVEIDQMALYVRMVRALDLREGVIEATVVPSKAKPHRVQVRVPAFTQSQWARLARQVVDDQTVELVVEALARPEVPLAFLEAADRHKLQLLPRRVGLLASACTCGGARVPCAHVLALHLAFSKRIDADPRTLLSLRGGEPETISALVSRVNEQADTHESSSLAADDPLAAPDAPEPDWALLSNAPVARAPLPALDGWRGRETFDAVARRIAAQVRGA